MSVFMLIPYRLVIVRRKVGEHSENLNKEIKSIRKQQADFTELKNTTTELKKYTRTLRQQMK